MIKDRLLIAPPALLASPILETKPMSFYFQRDTLSGILFFDGSPWVGDCINMASNKPEYEILGFIHKEQLMKNYY